MGSSTPRLICSLLYYSQLSLSFVGKIAILIFVPFGQSDSNQRCKIGTGSNQKLSPKLKLFTGTCYPVGIHREKICIWTPWKSITSYTFCQFRPSQSSERKTETMIFPLEIFEKKKKLKYCKKLELGTAEILFYLYLLRFSPQDTSGRRTFDKGSIGKASTKRQLWLRPWSEKARLLRRRTKLKVGRTHIQKQLPLFSTLTGFRK